MNRICQEEPQWDQGDDRERGSQQCAAGGERDRFRTLTDQEETVPGKGGESRIFRRRPEEHGRDEVEDRVAPRGREEETGQQKAHRLRLGRDVRDEGRNEARPRGLCGKEGARPVVDVKSGRQSRQRTRQEAEDRQDEKARDETERGHDGKSALIQVYVSGARRLHSTTSALGRSPSSASGGLDHEQVATPKFERHLRGQAVTPAPPHEQVLPGAAIISAFETFRPKGTTFRADRGGAFAREESNRAANAVAAGVLASAAGPWDEPVLLDAERVRELEGSDRRGAW